jgi:hypothetical protein
MIQRLDFGRLTLGRVPGCGEMPFRGFFGGNLTTPSEGSAHYGVWHFLTAVAVVSGVVVVVAIYFFRPQAHEPWEVIVRKGAPATHVEPQTSRDLKPEPSIPPDVPAQSTPAQQDIAKSGPSSQSAAGSTDVALDIPPLPKSRPRLRYPPRYYWADEIDQGDAFSEPTHKIVRKLCVPHFDWPEICFAPPKNRNETLVEPWRALNP